MLVATRTGLVRADFVDPAWTVRETMLAGHVVTTATAVGDVVLAGTTGGLFRSGDGGRTWQEANTGLSERHIRWLQPHPDDALLVMAGTEPAAVFVSLDAGQTWQERPEVAALRDEFGWWLPYSPEAGCVRGFAAHGDRLYGAVEVGGLLRSDDRGASWSLASGSDGRPQFGTPRAGLVHPDVHSIEVHPSSADRLYAPTGGGYYVSGDGGATWDCRYVCYVRAAVVDSLNPDVVIIGPAENSSGRQGRIERTDDGGLSWERVAGPWDNHMIDRFYRDADHLYAVTSQGHLLQAGLDGQTWQRILDAVPGATDLVLAQ